MLKGEKPQPKGYTGECQTVGDHIKKVRMDKKLLQQEVANILGVNVLTIGNWENGKAKPVPKSIISVIQFLGYTPDCVQDFPQLLNPVFAFRLKHNYTQKQLAQLTGLDKTTIQAIEAGTRTMIDRTRKKLRELHII